MAILPLTSRVHAVTVYRTGAAARAAMAALSRASAEARDVVSAVLRGCGQVAFCDSRSGGALILGGVLLAAPFSALGMLYGALVGTVVGRVWPLYPREGWTWGLAGFNPAIIGLVRLVTRGR